MKSEAATSIYSTNAIGWRKAAIGLWAIVLSAGLSLVALLLLASNDAHFAILRAAANERAALSAQLSYGMLYTAAGLVSIVLFVTFVGLAQCAAIPLPAASRYFNWACVLLLLSAIAVIAGGSRLYAGDAIWSLVFCGIGVFAAGAWQIAFFAGVAKVTAHQKGLSAKDQEASRSLKIMSQGGALIVLGSLGLLAATFALTSFPVGQVTSTAIACIWIASGLALFAEIVRLVVSGMFASFVLRQPEVIVIGQLEDEKDVVSCGELVEHFRSRNDV